MEEVITAIDTHVHVLKRDLPMVTDRHSPLMRDYDLPELLSELTENGVSHALLTAPSVYTTDNSLLLGALRAGQGRLRGTVILDPAEPIETLVALSKVGVCGIRLNWWRKKSLPDIRAYRELLAKVRDVGWHLELFIDGIHIPEVMPTIRQSGVTLVFDHFGCPEPVKGVEGPGFLRMLDEVQRGNVWVKLSAPYRLGGGDACAYVERLVKNSGVVRLVWGSDWPWGGFEEGMTYRKCLDWLEEWIPDEEKRKTVLVSNPAELFGFR